jgi:ParB family chromosome partitioning protein
MQTERNPGAASTARGAKENDQPVTTTNRPKIAATQAVEIGSIIVPPDRMRRLRPEKVDEFAESIGARGLVHAIVVSPIGDGFRLIAGWHRLEAARKLGWNSIPAVVADGLDADAAELIEIDENLIRADLTDAERALHLARRKELYEKAHPETKKGATGRGRKKSQ